MPKNYSQKDFEKDLKELEYLIKNNNKNAKNSKSVSKLDNMHGGKIEKDDKVRTFTVSILNGKELTEEIGDISIKEGRTPLSAAKKLFSSLAKHNKLKGNAKHSFKATFMIREKTRSRKTHDKVYGPYSGKYHKYTPDEIKKSEIKLKSGKIIRHTLRPDVKLSKSNKSNKSSNQKGGK